MTMPNLSSLLARTLRTAALAAVLLAFRAAPIALADDPEFEPRQALVRLAPGQPVAAFNARYGTSVIDAVPERSIYLLHLPDTRNEQEFVDLFDADPAVLFADLNFYAEDTDPDGTTQDIFLARDYTQYQNDPSIGLVNVPLAAVASRGAGVVVAVIDSGLDTAHPAFTGRLAPGGYDFVSDTQALSDPSPGAFAGHGTIVAGIIARIAPESRLMPLRVLAPDGRTTTFRVARAIYHALDNGAHIINISLGTLADPDTLRDAVAEAQARGVLVVAAAGNDDARDPPRSPAALQGLGVVSVASLDHAMVKSRFSNFGAWITLCAPGENIHGPVPGGGYGSATGTSFAAPMAAGVAALLVSSCPQQPPASVRQRLISGATSIDPLNPNHPGELGAGMLNAAGSLASIFRQPGRCRCPADFNGLDGVTTQDVFDFINAWFSNSPLADLDGSSSLTVQEIFTFLAAFFDGCP
ncbi:MAG: S8 family serine peptidase [Phycisphaerales bacterium]